MLNLLRPLAVDERATELLADVASRLQARSQIKEKASTQIEAALEELHEGQVKEAADRLFDLSWELVAPEDGIYVVPGPPDRMSDEGFPEWRRRNSAGLVVDELSLVVHRPDCTLLTADAPKACFIDRSRLDYWLNSRKVAVTGCEVCRAEATGEHTLGP